MPHDAGLSNSKAEPRYCYEAEIRVLREPLWWRNVELGFDFKTAKGGSNS